MMQNTIPKYHTEIFIETFNEIPSKIFTIENFFMKTCVSSQRARIRSDEQEKEEISLNKTTKLLLSVVCIKW